MDIFNEIDGYLDSNDEISLSDVKRWMQNDDISVQGAVADIIISPTYSQRIQPPLDQQEIEGFLIKYYERCLIEDPEDENACSQYEVGMELLSWFSAVPKDEDIMSQVMLVHFKDWLADLYLRAEDEVKTAIVNSFLKHVLEEPRWRKFFGDWKQKSLLEDAYNEAMEWAQEHER